MVPGTVLVPVPYLVRYGVPDTGTYCKAPINFKWRSGTLPRTGTGTNEQ